MTLHQISPFSAHSNFPWLIIKCCVIFNLLFVFWPIVIDFPWISYLEFQKFSIFNSWILINTWPFFDSLIVSWKKLDLFLWFGYREIISEFARYWFLLANSGICWKCRTEIILRCLGPSWQTTIPIIKSSMKMVLYPLLLGKRFSCKIWLKIWEQAWNSKKNTVLKKIPISGVWLVEFILESFDLIT